MFNSKKFVDSVFHEAWAEKIAGVRKMCSSAPRSYAEILTMLISLKSDERDRFLDNLQGALWILNRELPQSFSIQTMNQGKGMIFHPVSGDPIRTLKLKHEEKLVYYATDTTGGEWGSGRQMHSRMDNVAGEFFWRGETRLPLIGGRSITLEELNCPDLCGYPYWAGSPYLSHWKYCPWTGEELKKGEETNENSIQ